MQGGYGSSRPCLENSCTNYRLFQASFAYLFDGSTSIVVVLHLLDANVFPPGNSSVTKIVSLFSNKCHLFFARTHFLQVTRGQLSRRTACLPASLPGSVLTLSVCHALDVIGSTHKRKSNAPTACAQQARHESPGCHVNSKI
jgi:hypothetical protein